MFDVVPSFIDDSIVVATCSAMARGLSSDRRSIIESSAPGEMGPPA